jgi:hypothetical protein
MKSEDQESNPRVTDSIVQHLNEGTRTLDTQTLSELYDLRREAVSQLHTHGEKPTGVGVLALRRHPAMLGLAFAFLVAASVWFMYQTTPNVAPLDTAELDIALLTGAVPPQVFADWSLATQDNIEAVCIKDF